MSREQDYINWIATHPEKLADPLTRMDDMLDYLNISSARTEDLMMNVLTTLQAIASAGGISIGRGATLDTVIPINPKALTELVMSMSDAIPGIAQVFFNLFAYTVPGPGAFTITTTTPSGWVIVFTDGLELTSDFYDPNLTFTLTVADDIIAVNTPITRNILIPWSVFKPVRDNLLVTFTAVNTTLITAVVSATQTSLGLEKNYFESFYKPLLQKGYVKLQEVLEFVEGSLSYGS